LIFILYFGTIANGIFHFNVHLIFLSFIGVKHTLVILLVAPLSFYAFFHFNIYVCTIVFVYIIPIITCMLFCGTSISFLLIFIIVIRVLKSRRSSRDIRPVGLPIPFSCDFFEVFWLSALAH